MDNSKEYVLMCKKSNEVQYVEKEVFIGGEQLSEQLVKEDGRNYWIPRQDQLQEMIRERYENDYDMLDNFFCWMCDFEEYPYITGMGSAIDGWSQNEETRQYKSMEQLWLAFVMEDKYKKRWAGKEWTDVLPT